MNDPEPTSSGAFSFAISSGESDDVEPESKHDPVRDAPPLELVFEHEEEFEHEPTSVAGPEPAELVSAATWTFWLAWILIGLGLLLVLWAVISN